TNLEGTTHPENIGRLIEQTVPDYCIDSNAYEYADPGEFLASVERMVDARTRVFEDLIRRERPDLFVGVYVSTDRVQHGFWKQAAHPWSDGERAGWRFATAVRDCYRQLDAALGRLVEAVDGDPTVIVMSDHGFGDLEGDLYLNSLLEEMELLTLKRGSEGVVPGFLGGLVDRVRGRDRSEDGSGGPEFGDIDWQQTRAYSRGLFGNIWLNLRGREPDGQVEPGPEAEKLLEQITERLLELEEPGGRAPLIDAVFRGKDLYWGGCAEQAPDLVVVPHEYRWMTRSGREIAGNGQLTGAPAIRHTGNHRMNGVIVAGGPGIRVGVEPEVRRLLDLTPTSLALLGIELPRSLDGLPMKDLLACDVGWTDDVPDWEPLPGAPSTKGEAAELADQLRGLGYLADS
ncbi:MAG: alkaline phosphatase family protein, partial [Myxococcota bacterium]|nr:alkaline phosphatase family protein [Myxococcota bacterium]